MLNLYSMKDHIFRSSEVNGQGHAVSRWKSLEESRGKALMAFYGDKDTGNGGLGWSPEAQQFCCLAGSLNLHSRMANCSKKNIDEK